jgi:RHS repeat-associated protein
MERDDTSGFGYHGARYYATWLARWESPDPSGLDDGVNTYEYVAGNPIDKIDPSGLDGEAVYAVKTDMNCRKMDCVQLFKDTFTGKTSWEGTFTPTDFETSLQVSKNSGNSYYPIIQQGVVGISGLVGWRLLRVEDLGGDGEIWEDFDRKGTSLGTGSRSGHGSMTPGFGASLLNPAELFAVTKGTKLIFGGARALVAEGATAAIDEGFATLASKEGSEIATRAASDVGSSAVKTGGTAAADGAAPNIQRTFLKPPPRPAPPGDPAMTAAHAAMPKLARDTGAVGKAVHAIKGAAPHGADFETRNSVTELVTTTSRRQRPSTTLIRKKTLQASGDGAAVPGYVSRKAATVLGEETRVHTEALMVRFGEYVSGEIEWLARALAKRGIR